MSNELEPIAASDISALHYLKSYDMYPPTRRPYIVVNMMNGDAKFYMNGMKKNPTKKELAQYTWDLGNTLVQCERQLESLMKVLNYMLEDSGDNILRNRLEEYLEDYPETAISRHEVDLADLEHEILISKIQNRPTNVFPRVHKLREIIGKAKGGSDE